MAERRRTRRTAADRERADEQAPAADEQAPEDEQAAPADDELEPAEEPEAADGEPEAGEEPGPADEEYEDDEEYEEYEDEDEDDEDREAAGEPAADGRGRDRRRARHRDEPALAASDPALTAREAARAALRQIVELTDKRPEGVTGIERTDDGGWSIGVEVVEDRRIPSSTDILATYQAIIDAEGELMSYRRIRRYARGRGDSSEGA